MRVFAFVAAQKADFPVRTLYRVCKVSTSGFYAYAARKARLPRPRELARALVARHIVRVRKSSRRRCSTDVAIEDTTSNRWWSGSSFGVSAQTFVAVTGNTTWYLPLETASLTSGDS
jgi:hypothetical protein